MEEKLIFLICVLLAAVAAMALYLREIEKEIDNIENAVLSHMTWLEKQKALNSRMLKWYQNSQIWREEQGEINYRTLTWCKNTDETIDNMLETQAKLVDLGNETYTKYLEVQAQINGIKFEIEQKDLVAEYCKNDVVATEAVLIDEEEENDYA